MQNSTHCCALDARAEPLDAGFTQRLLQRLPARRRAAAAGRLAERITQLAALCAAALAFSLLWPELLGAMQQGQGGEAGLTALVLLALIVGLDAAAGALQPLALTRQSAHA